MKKASTDTKKTTRKPVKKPTKSIVIDDTPIDYIKYIKEIEKKKGKK